MIDCLLTVNDLTMQFGDLIVVENVSFTLSKNKKLAIIGPKRVGKSTTIKSILNIVKP